MAENTIDFTLHYNLRNKEEHFLDAIVYNECQKQIISSLYQISKVLDLDIDEFNVLVSPAEEGSFVDRLKVVSNNHIVQAALTTLMTLWLNSYFNANIDVSNEAKNNIEAAIQIKQSNLTAEEVMILVQDNPKLQEFCSKYFKSAATNSMITGVDVSAVDNNTNTRIQSTVNSDQFQEHIVESQTNTTIVNGTTVIIASPVLADVKRLKWHGIYNTQHINFSMEDNDFIDLVHNRRVTFEYETSINCDLKIVERKVGNKPATYSYTVLRVHSYLDATHLEENGRRYTRVNHLRDDD